MFNRVMSQEAFEAVVSAHHDEIYRYLRRMIGGAGDADDLSQETFLRAFRAYRSLPGDSNVRAWLFSIATNLAKNHFRSEARRRQAYGEVRASVRQTGDPPPEAELVSRETGALVEEIVRRLPLKQRLAFTQRKIHGLGRGRCFFSLFAALTSRPGHACGAEGEGRSDRAGSGCRRRTPPDQAGSGRAY